VNTAASKVATLEIGTKRKPNLVCGGEGHGRYEELEKQYLRILRCMGDDMLRKKSKELGRPYLAHHKM
jgi:hypothetical protein